MVHPLMRISQVTWSGLLTQFAEWVPSTFSGKTGQHRYGQAYTRAEEEVPGHLFMFRGFRRLFIWLDHKLINRWFLRVMLFAGALAPGGRHIRIRPKVTKTPWNKALNGIDNPFQVFPFRLVAFGGLADRTVALSPVCVCDAVGFELLVQEIQCPIFLQVLLQAGCILEQSRWMVCFSLFIHHAWTSCF